MQGLGSHDQRRAHRVEGKFLKVVTGLLGENLVDHESLVAPPGCFELAGRAQPQLRVAVHGEPGRAPAGPSAAASARPAGAAGAGVRGSLSPAPGQPGRQRGSGGARRGADTGRAGRASRPTRRSASSRSLFGTAQLSISARFLQGPVLSRAERRPPRGVGAHPALPACATGARTCGASCPPLSLASSRLSVSRAPLPASLF